MSTFDAGTVGRRLSAERMATYLDAADDDERAALELYDWNVRAAGALYEDIGRVEVVLRNAFDVALSELGARRGWRDPWFERRQLFPGRHGARAVIEIDLAAQRARRRGVPVVHGRVIAELTSASGGTSVRRRTSPPSGLRRWRAPSRPTLDPTREWFDETSSARCSASTSSGTGSLTTNPSTAATSGGICVRSSASPAGCRPTPRRGSPPDPGPRGCSTPGRGRDRVQSWERGRIMLSWAKDATSWSPAKTSPRP